MAGSTGHALNPVGARGVAARFSRSPAEWAVAALGLVVLVGGVLLLTGAYVGAEHTLYTWDFHEYTTRLEQTYATARRSPLTALVEIYLSTSQEYNLLPTIPLLPLRYVLGASRLAFELNAALVFIVPFALAVGWIGSRSLPGPRAIAFWATAAVALAMPYTWVATLRGFVDLGSAAMVAAAIGLYVGDMRLTRPWRPIAIGVLLGAAFLFRRPFAYDGLALCAAIGLVVLIRFARGARADQAVAVRSLGRDVLGLGLVAVGGIVFLVAFGHRLLGRLALSDYGSLYEGWVRGPLDVLGWIGSGYGWLFVGLAAVGFIAALRRGVAGQRIAFVGLYGALLTAIWAFVVGQEDVHYAAHFAAPIGVGVTAFAYWLWGAAQRSGGRRAAVPAVAILGGLLVINLAAGLMPIAPNNGSLARSLVGAANPPLVRTDYDVVESLDDDLRSIAGTDRPVLVNGDTDFFSDDTVVIADQVGHADGPPLFVLTSPHVDSRDTYPLTTLLAADVIVVPDPLPLTLSPDKQGVQRVVHDLFVPPGAAASSASPFAAAFRARPESFTLEDGTRVRVFERTRPTTVDEAVAALRLIREYTPIVPGSQVPWVSVGGLSGAVTDAAGDRPSVIESGRGPDGDWAANSLVYVGADEGTTIDGAAEFLDRTCGGLAITVSSTDGTLAPGAARRFELRPGGDSNFRISGLGPDARDLLIASEQLDPSKPCIAEVALTAAASDADAARSLLRNDAGTSAP
jgi:hypothetical protein